MASDELDKFCDEDCEACRDVDVKLPSAADELWLETDEVLDESVELGLAKEGVELAETSDPVELRAVVECVVELGLVDVCVELEIADAWVEPELVDV